MRKNLVFFFLSLCFSISSMATLPERLDETLRHFYPDEVDSVRGVIAGRLAVMAGELRVQVLIAQSHEERDVEHGENAQLLMIFEGQTAEWQSYYFQAELLKRLYLDEKLYLLTREEVAANFNDYLWGSLYPLQFFVLGGCIRIMLTVDMGPYESAGMGAAMSCYAFATAMHHEKFTRACWKIGQKCRDGYAWSKKTAKACYRRALCRREPELPQPLQRFFDELRESAAVIAEAV